MQPKCNNLVNNIYRLGFPGGSVVKNLPASARDTGDSNSIPGSERFPATHSSIPPGSPKVGHNRTHTHLLRLIKKTIKEILWKNF